MLIIEIFGEKIMQKKYFYVANWKSYLPYRQAIDWCTSNAPALKTLNNDGHVIVCPDFLAVAEIQKIVAPVVVGAQSCSVNALGAFTGEISAQSLKEAGAAYCIIGHSERRKLFGETSEVVAQKMALLFEQDITPIICISDEWEVELLPVLKKIEKNHILIAYEPLSAIGTGTIPPIENIEKTVTSIKEKITTSAPNAQVKMLYGGSVNAQNSAELKQIPGIDGFLIGKASTIFEEFRNIVLIKA